VSRTSVLPAGVTLVGAIEGAGDLVIAGTVEGPIELDGGLVIEEGGRVHGDVSVTTLIVRGVLSGDASAQETIRLEGSAMVVGDAVAPRVHIVDGARVRGRVRMNGEPMVPKAVRRPRRPAEEPAAAFSAGSSAGSSAPSSSGAVSSSAAVSSAGKPVSRKQVGHTRTEHVPPQLAHDDDDAIALEGAPTAVGAPAALDEESPRPRRTTRSRGRKPAGDEAPEETPRADAAGDEGEGRRSRKRRRGRRRGGRQNDRPEREQAPAPKAETKPEPAEAKADEPPKKKRRRPPPPNMPTVGRQKAKRKDRSDANPAS